MKIALIVAITLVFFANVSFGQNKNTEDFIEFGFNTSRFIKSSFLQNSTYRSQISDPGIEYSGIAPSLTGVNYGVKFRFGKGLSPKTHLIGELGYTTRNEQVQAFCHSCGLIKEIYTLAVINSIDFGIGIRQHLFTYGKFNVTIEGLGNYAVSTNEPDLSFFGYFIYPVVQYQFNKKLGMNLRYGFGQSFNRYQKMERYFEVALNYTIGKKAEALLYSHAQLIQSK